MVNGYRVARQPSLGMFAAAAIAFMGMQRCYRHPRYPGDCAAVARGHALLMYATMGHYTLTAVYGGDANFTGSSMTNQVTITGPMVNAGPDASVVRGNLFTSAGSFTQVGTSATWTATVDYGDGSGAQPLSLAGMTFALSHTIAQCRCVLRDRARYRRYESHGDRCRDGDGDVSGERRLRRREWRQCGYLPRLDDRRIGGWQADRAGWFLPHRRHRPQRDD